MTASSINTSTFTLAKVVSGTPTAPVAAVVTYSTGNRRATLNPAVDLTLANGSHTFSVRATDAAGNVDATPATRTWTINITTPPADKIILAAQNVKATFLSPGSRPPPIPIWCGGSTRKGTWSRTTPTPTPT